MAVPSYRSFPSPLLGMGLNGGQNVPIKESSGDYEHPMDVESFRVAAKSMIDWICDYYDNVESLPVRSELSVGDIRSVLPSEAPTGPESWNKISSDFQEKIMPGVMHWQSPNFYAYFPSAFSFPSLLGDLMSSALSVNGFLWVSSPAATELETVVVDWLGKMMGLPQAFLAIDSEGKRGKGGGVVQTTASECTLVALLAARARIMEGRPLSDTSRLVCYFSDQAHSSVRKACMVAVTPHVRVLPTCHSTGFSMEPALLEAAIKEDLAAGLLPFYMVGTIGTTSSCAVDPIGEMGAIAQKYKLWLHVDGAHAGVAAILPEQRHHFAGVELADSFNTNPHKWLLTTFDCSCIWFRDADPLKAALSLTPAYLRGKGNAYDYQNWEIPVGRRFRSLKLWFVLRAYGQEKLQGFLRHHIRLAETVAALARKDERFEVSAPPRFGLVCFRLKGRSNEDTSALIEAFNKTGKAFLITTDLAGQTVARIACGGFMTQERHVRATWQLIGDTATALFSAPEE
ncbi:hypothetical protein CVIRNUC_000044 [Coccomyxa viridis]|uniref:Aromatic-L-amino-acid decarboxylase n=1 Tax=Coccomyxa viridis TaxID=1274662 RepID=A0AAV1HP50_9CHLO|nr:hypothetical protein CVIRNUC_000044 [Coccomyxa viridis]